MKSEDKARGGIKFKAVSGVRDILPPESALWNRVERVAHEVFATYSFSLIALPIFEETEVFARSIGAHTDVVSKEMYSWEDHPLPGLEEDRQELLAAEITDADSLVNFPGDFSALVHRLKRVQAAGELNEENEARVEELVRLESRADFKHLIRDLPQTFDDLHNAMSEAKRLVKSVDLGKVLTLRPEATASVVRAYIEHGMHTLPGDVKLYYTGPMFRRERPQKGRYRQFYQIGAEVLTPSPKDVPENVVRDAGVDAEVIEMVLTFIERCGLVGHTLYINSIGCRECRPKYVELLRAKLTKVKDKLGPDSQRRIETNPLRVLDSKLESEQAVIETLPRIGDHLCEACREHFKMLQAMLFMRQIAYEVNWRLVRGLDYYMRTTFEITAPGLGAQNAICGGGRYDGLVELLGGPLTKGMGFALGTDRLILALQEAGKGAASASGGLDAYIAWMGANAYPVAVRIARTLRDAGFSVELPHEEMKFKKSLGLAGRLGARFAVILGDNEVAGGTATVKRMADATQQTIAERDLAAHLRG